MKIVFKIALGIIAAVGGFLDIGDLVFNTQAGALYRYDLLWAVALGTLGIAVYAEMSGRVAAVTQRPVFDVIRMRMGFGMGLVALLASTFVNVLPLTYLPILLIAGDRSFMGKHVNGPASRALGWVYFALIVVLAVVAIPLLLATNGGGG